MKTNEFFRICLVSLFVVAVTLGLTKLVAQEEPAEAKLKVYVTVYSPADPGKPYRGYWVGYSQAEYNGDKNEVELYNPDTKTKYFIHGNFIMIQDPRIEAK